MASTVQLRADEPLSEMNTTPLIDVLLVLLVTLVMAVPAANHAIELNLPAPGPGKSDPVRNQLSLTEGGAILWNGESVSRAELDGLLAEVRTMSPEPQVQFEPEAQASYELSASVLRQVKQAQLTNFGIAGTQRYREFSR